MKLKEIHRTSTFAWSPYASLPLLATGTVAGALDESFSNESQLEIWAPDFLDKHEFDLGAPGQNGPRGVVKDTARFNRLTWGYVDTSRPKGVIAAGMENGELALWDPSKILAGAGSTDSLILRNNQHTGPVRALDFNPIQTSLLSSGATGGEVYIWDLKDPSKPYTPTPGTRSTKLDEITSVAWNQQVQYVLAGASSTGYTVVWDLRGKREVVALAYGGGAGTLAGQTSHGNGLAVGGRRGMSAIAWHPDNATRLVTASEDDSSPVIMVWDLRNARAPEKILTGHEKGVLSLSWCKQDPDLLLSCGKDNRVLCWNPQSSEIIGELPSADNWAFQVEWCPRNPDLLASAFFDGTVGIHSIQSTNESASAAAAAVPTPLNGADVFDVSGTSSSSQGASGGGTLSLKQPPKWLRRPVASSFGFGGKLVTVSNLPSAAGKNQSSAIHVRNVVTEEEIVRRAKELQDAIESQGVKAFAEGKVNKDGEESDDEIWKALLSMYQAESRDELVMLLGFSKDEVKARIAEAVEKLKMKGLNKEEEEEDLAEMKPPVVSFLEPEFERGPATSAREADGHSSPESTGLFEKTPSERSTGGTSAASDAATTTSSGATQLAETESTTTAPSLFGDEGGAGGDAPAGDDFFSAIATGGVDVGAGGGATQQQVLVPHTNYPIDSSVAATIGSRPSSVAPSEVLKSTTFKIYPAGDGDDESTAAERLITEALVLGDFGSAVELCLAGERYADALVLAVRGGPELLAKTQKVYFERCGASGAGTPSYLRLLESIVANDLADVVQNAELGEWKEVFVVLCTFASRSGDEFAGLVEQLGRRLEFEYTVGKADDREKVVEYRKYATLTYLAAARLERLVGIWLEEMVEEEERLVGEGLFGSRYTAHAYALQTFVEKVTVFREATKYVDGDLASGGSASSDVAKTYKLAGLYERYVEYAEVLASQGMLKEAREVVKLTPEGFKGSAVVVGVGAGVGVGSGDLEVARKRLIGATAPATQVPSNVGASTSKAAYGGGYGQPGRGGYPSVPAPAAPAGASYGLAAGAGGYQPPTNTYQTSAGSNGPYGQQPGHTGPYSQTGSSSGPYGQTGHAGHAGPYGQTGPSPGLHGQTGPSPVAPPPGPYGVPQSTNTFTPAAANTFTPAGSAYNPYGTNMNAGPQVPHAVQNQPQQPPLGPPPSRAPPATLPPPPKRDNGGWNDAPVVNPISRSSSVKPTAITSPFPNANPNVSPSPLSPPTSGSFGGQQQPMANFPPPPQRPASVTGGRAPPANLPPPPQGRFPPPPTGAGVRSPSVPAGSGMHQPPPPQGSQFGAPPTRGSPMSGQTPPPPPPGQGQYGRPPPQMGQMPPPPSGPYARATPPPMQGMQPMQPHSGPYAPPPGQGQGQGPAGMQSPPTAAPPPSGPYAPPPGAIRPGPGGPPPQPGRPVSASGGPPPPGGPSGAGAPPPARAPPQKAGPPPPKYPPGDRSHIPDYARPAYEVISREIERLRSSVPPAQKRQVDDLERRINPLFDALNCETLSRSVVDQLLVLTGAMEAHDRPAALAIHVDLLTRGSQTDNIALWMSGVKQLIMRL